jgi:hypothetical protein
MLLASAEIYGLVDVESLIQQHLLGGAAPGEVAALSRGCAARPAVVTGAVLPVDAGATAQ